MSTLTGAEPSWTTLSGLSKYRAPKPEEPNPNSSSAFKKFRAFFASDLTRKSISPV